MVGREEAVTTGKECRPEDQFSALQAGWGDMNEHVEHGGRGAENTTTVRHRKAEQDWDPLVSGAELMVELWKSGTRLAEKKRERSD